ncbi:MAG TPA: hypothetical protein VFM18_17350 [Methanosarcina sp.]|nr:hypothetical protein [Methanosarcina sp.]
MFFNTLDRIRLISAKHSGKTYTPEALTKLIRSQFRDSALRFYTKKDARIAKHNILIGGEYVPHDDEDDEPCIHIHLTYSTKDKIISIDKVDWGTLGFHIANVITHEYIHRYHISKRNFKFGRSYKNDKISKFETTMQDYLGCQDEIIAYGFNCAAEIVVYNLSFENTKTYILYRKHFNEDHQVLKKLKKQTTQYLRQLKEELYGQL